MRKSVIGLSALLLASAAAPAMAQDEPSDGVKITGSVGLVSDYRFRGFTQNLENAAVQGGITATHESGFYVGTWGSSVNLYGPSNTEIDLFAGYSTEVSPGVTVDAGVLYYLYPNKTSEATDFFEPYVNVIGAIGPVTAKVGVNFAWKQNALLARDNVLGVTTGRKASAIYFHAEPSIAIPNTPFGLNAHVGYAVSDAFPGGYTPYDHDVLDYSVGATATYKILTFGVSYVNTDQKVNKEANGADGAVVFSLTAAF
ncbi:MAG: TorF family putative porin [Sphingobium sp.]